MTPRDALFELLARVGANKGAPIFIGVQELNEWPTVIVAAMKAQNLLAKASPAASVVCPGCDRECVMPIHAMPQGPRDRSVFVVCNKRSDINRVRVPVEHLEQWKTSAESIAEFTAHALGLRRLTGGVSNAGRWEIGTIKGARHSSHLILSAEDGLALSLAGHSICLADVLDVKNNRIVIDERILIRRVDSPVAGAGDVESAEMRRERLRGRVTAEKAKGTRDFLQVVATEEGFSVSRLKQLVGTTGARAKNPFRTDRGLSRRR